MSDAESRFRGLWFEEFTPGLMIQTRGRTITETDLVNFAGVSGDYNPMHTNADYAQTTDFKARVAHGALIFSVATGLAYQLGILEGTVIAFREFGMKLSLPVFIGDTIHVDLTVKESKPMARLGGGLVVLDVRVINQRDDVVQRGDWAILMKAAPKTPK
ncbi:MAG TPA: MaoC/PaaZ C-terminal domain-containing protein [Aggregatilineales bacterium]|nr:dehydratase [Anaerolineales bacterium]HRE46418.1 MaoC/PaaZ C-terminal domain-containing protein [Aggregatilineales bacterium]